VNVTGAPPSVPSGAELPVDDGVLLLEQADEMRRRSEEIAIVEVRMVDF
jgi:hypothetical protein